jgi:hypothetical protein
MMALLTQSVFVKVLDDRSMEFSRCERRVCCSEVVFADQFPGSKQRNAQLFIPCAVDVVLPCPARCGTSSESLVIATVEAAKR